jgi:hypothetical protein
MNWGFHLRICGRMARLLILNSGSHSVWMDNHFMVTARLAILFLTVSIMSYASLSMQVLHSRIKVGWSDRCRLKEVKGFDRGWIC